MKPSHAAKALTVIAVFTLALIAGPGANAAIRRCSNATLRGTYETATPEPSLEPAPLPVSIWTPSTEKAT